MATITTRSGKGSPLTNTEVDNNFENLNTAKIENVVDDTTPQLGGNLDTNGHDIVFGDGEVARFGDATDGNGDLVIKHESNNSYIIDRGTGELYIQGSTNVVLQNFTGSKNYFVGANGGASTIYHDGNPKLATSSTGVTVTGTVAADGVSLGDSEKATFGAGGDLEIFHDGENSRIYDVGTGALVMRSNQLNVQSPTGEKLAIFNQDNDVQLYYDGGKKLSTTSTGVDVAGELNVDKLVSDTALPKTRPSLLMDFVNNPRIDPRMTFSRISTATYWDGKTVKKAESNLWLSSQDFNATYHSVSEVTVTNNNATAPDGTTTAAKVQDKSTGQSHYIVVTDNYIDHYHNHTLSFYVKYGSGYGWVGIGLASGRLAWFDVQNGVQGSTPHSTVQSTRMVDVGNGWYRCIVTIDPPQATDYWQIRLCNADNSTTYTANGSYVYVWGAQLEVGDYAGPYIATTSSRVTTSQPVMQTAGLHTPRFDHNPLTSEPRGLLIETGRTNRSNYSGDVVSGWSPDNCTYDRNAGMAPDGTHTATKISPDGTTNRHRLSRGITTTTGATYTLSVFVKSAGGGTCWLNCGARLGAVAGFELSGDGTVYNAGGNNVDEGIEAIGNGWYRVWVTGNALASTNPIYIQVQDTGQYSDSSWGTGEYYTGILVWGAQVEEGAFPTSYIPTEGSSVARQTDSVYDYSIQSSGWFNPGKGTALVEYVYFDNYAGSPYPRTHFWQTDASRTTIELMHYGGKTYTNYFYRNSLKHSGQVSVSAGQIIRQAGSWDVTQSDFVSGQNGSTGAAYATSGQPTEMNRFNLGESGYCGWVRKFAFYPEYMSTDQLAVLTEEQE